MERTTNDIPVMERCAKRIMTLREYPHIPRINLTLVKENPKFYLPIGRCVGRVPSLSEIIDGAYYSDFHKDPLYKGYLAAIFVQSCHVQDVCLVIMSEVSKDERYANEKVREKIASLRREIDTLSKKEAEIKTTDEFHLSLWEHASKVYRSQVNDETNAILDASMGIYQRLGHEDAFVAGLFATAYTLANSYMLILRRIGKDIERKYNYLKLSKFVKEFQTLSDTCSSLRQECERCVGFRNVNLYENEGLYHDANMVEAIRALRKKLEKGNLWESITNDFPDMKKK